MSIVDAVSLIIGIFDQQVILPTATSNERWTTIRHVDCKLYFYWYWL